MNLENRNLLPLYFNDMDYEVGAEIGIQDGIFSRVILNNWPGKLFMIDSWRYIEGYQDIGNKSDISSNVQHYANTLVNVYEFGTRATIIREFSHLAANLIEDESLDFVYLDADHSYEGVKNDIDTWFPKIRQGGCLCGHDYLNGERFNTIFGVKKAVKEFAKAHKYKINVTKEKDFPSWYITL